MDMQRNPSDGRTRKDNDIAAAQRQSPNQEIANDANNKEQEKKADSGSGSTARTGTKPHGTTD